MRASFQTGTTWRATATVRWNTAPTVSTDNFLRISDGGDVITTGRVISPGYVIPQGNIYSGGPTIVGASDHFLGTLAAEPYPVIPASAQPGDVILFVGNIPATGSFFIEGGGTLTIVTVAGGFGVDYAYKVCTGAESGKTLAHSNSGGLTGRIFVVRGIDPSIVAESSTASGAVSQPNPPAINPSWGTSVGTLVFAYVHGSAATTAQAFGIPFGYDASSDQFSITIITTTTDSYVSLSKNAGNITTDDPTSVSHSTVPDTWEAGTIAFKGASPLRVRTNYRVVQPGKFVNNSTIYAPTRPGGTISIAPSTFTNAQTIPSPKLISTLKPAILANSQTFFTPKIILTVKPAVLANTSVFQSPKVNRTVKPAVFANTQTFFSPKIIATLKPAVLANAQTFFTPKVNRTLKPAVLSNGQTFFTETLRFTLKPAILANTQGFFTHLIRVTLKPAVFSNTSTLFGPTVTVAGSSKQPPVFVNTQTFFSPKIVVTLKPSVFANTQVFQSPRIVRTLKPATFANTQTFFGPTLKLTVKAGTYANLPVIFAPSLTVPLTIRPAVFVNAQTFYGPTVSTIVARRPEVMWPTLRRRKARSEEPEVEETIEPAAPKARKPKWAKGSLQDALTRAVGLPQVDEIKAPVAPAAPAKTMAQLQAEAAQRALEEQLARKAARLAAIRRDDDEVIALFLSRF